MATPFDVAARLAEGRPAVDDVEAYVAACHRLGYQHPDLTADARQVRDWYASEDGLDLRALDADCAVLSAVAAAAEDAALAQVDLVAEMAGAWSGRGAAAAGEFAWRSGRAATTVGAAIRAAADASTALRDALWRAVDAKVTAVTAVDGRHQAQRAEWLAAAAAVTTGTGDVAAASELVDQQVKPFVHNDIGSDWVAAMRAAAASIDAAFDASLATMTTVPQAVFDVPGELGPRAEPLAPAAVTRGSEVAASPVQTVPAAAVPSAPVPAVASGVAPAGVAPAIVYPGVPAPPASAMAPAAPSMPSMPAVGDLGAGTSSLGTGLSGFGQQLADLIGGLVGSTDGGLADADRPEDMGLEDPDEPEANEPDADEPDGDPAAEEAEDPDGPADESAEEPVVQPDPAPTPIPPPIPVEPPPAPPAAPDAAAVAPEPTPCEIAADELPQVGE